MNKLPIQAAPVQRGTSTAAFAAGVTPSSGIACTLCQAGCSQLSGFAQQLCMMGCNATVC